MCLFSNAQTFKVNITPSLSHLFNSKNDIGTISNTEKTPLFSYQVANQQAKFKLIKNKTGLFALVDGTGQVFKATRIDKNYIIFDRIDSTHYLGNTFESINFSYNNTIYSFGGYGFWNRHGVLSHFTPTAEWAIDKINKTYTTTNKFYSYYPHEGKIYYIEFPWKEESTPNIIANTSVIEFDIKKKENKLIGLVNSRTDFSFRYLTIDLPSLQGVLSYNEREIYLYQFNANKVYKLINNQIKEALIGKAGSELQTTFEDDGKIYYTYSNDPTLRSFTISMNDFKEEPYPIYISESFENYNWLTILALSVIALASAILVYTKRKKSKKQLISIDKEESYSTDLTSNEYNSIETTLINKLIEQSNIDSHLTVDELNSILGIKKKTIEIQKRVRTEAINRINHKFNVNYNMETTFIERKRSAEDRRYFNYIINKENAKTFLKK
jgi:hypothetical protein